MHQRHFKLASRTNRAMVKVCVIGAGVNGLASALKIKEKYKDFDVTIFSDVFTPNTTGDGSGGLWYPYLCGNTAQENLAKWGTKTYEFLHHLWRAGGNHVSMVPMYELHREEKQLTRPLWADLVFGYNELNTRQLEHLSKMHSIEYAVGRTFTTFVMQAPKLLEYLFERYKTANGKVVKARIASLADPRLQDFQVIVNCTGVRARAIVPDEKVFPIRGQIMRVEAPWINYTVVDEDSGHYIIPNDAFCVLGGTHQANDYRTEVDVENTQFISDGCQQMISSLKYAKVVKQWVGLRPGRDEIRLEAEERDGRLCIHNYGHGGSGLTLFWGCADEVLNLLEGHLGAKKTPDTISKL